MQKKGVMYLFIQKDSVGQMYIARSRSVFQYCVRVVGDYYLTATYSTVNISIFNVAAMSATITSAAIVTGS